MFSDEALYESYIEFVIICWVVSPDPSWSSTTFEIYHEITGFSLFQIDFFITLHIRAKDLSWAQVSLGYTKGRRLTPFPCNSCTSSSFGINAGHWGRVMTVSPPISTIYLAQDNSNRIKVRHSTTPTAHRTWLDAYLDSSLCHWHWVGGYSFNYKSWSFVEGGGVLRTRKSWQQFYYVIISLHSLLPTIPLRCPSIHQVYNKERCLVPFPCSSCFERHCDINVGNSQMALSSGVFPSHSIVQLWGLMKPFNLSYCWQIFTEYILRRNSLLVILR